MNLKTSSIVNPTILKGSRINHTSGKRNIMTNASGQQMTNKIHQRIMARKVFMIMINLTVIKQMSYHFSNAMILRSLHR